MTVLTMPAWFYDKHDMKRSPSIMDGLDEDTESRYRREGARFIINVGTKMGLRYDTMATGVVYFHRFYMFHSFKSFPRYIAACCCLFLAGKVEETPKKCKDIIRIAKSLLTEAQFAQFGDDPKEEVMTFERILLQTIKFDLQVDHPYGYLLRYAKCLKGEAHKLQNMVQMAWTFINDSLCTTLCLQCEPEVIAIALMYLAGKLSKFEVVDWNGRTAKHNSWWDIYVEGISIELLEDICHQVLDLYAMPPADTPHDSPPATPPTKSTIRKPPVQPSAIQLPTSPVETPMSPVAQPLSKPNEVPVGQPIPRLEPGELKRKVAAKMPPRKDSTERKSSRPSSATKDRKRRASVTSPSHSKRKVDTVTSSEVIGTQLSSSSHLETIVAATDAVYQTGVSQYPTVPAAALVVATASEVPKASATHALSSSSEPQYIPTYNQPVSYLPPDTSVSYFTDAQSTASSASYIQNASYLHSQVLPALIASQPPPQHTPSAAYAETYSSQPPPAVAVAAPPQTVAPQYPPATQYAAPPPQPPTNVLLPNVSVPPPTTAQAPPPPPPIPMSLPPPPRASLPHPSVPPPRIPMSPVMPPMSGRRPYGPRPEHDFYPRDGRGMSRDRLPVPRMRPPLFRAPPYYRDGPPDYDNRGMVPPFRGPRDMDYEDRGPDDMYRDYEDIHRPPPGSFPHEFGARGPRPPLFRFRPERGPRPPPILKNPPLMETPTGIAPVRITGSPFNIGNM